MPKSRNRKDHSLRRKVRRVTSWQGEILKALAQAQVIVNQHAQVVNASRDRIAKLELRVGLLEEKVYAGLSAEELARLGDLIDPQPPEPPVVEGEVVPEPIVEQPAA